ncbi:MAG: indolepyruvate ferredoxin oxidoreductase subunit alpha [Dehalococcoidia bacterium]
MHADVAKLVVEHYDKLPLSFPRTADGPATEYFDWVGWTDEEGKIFTSLTPFFEPLEEIAERAGRDRKEVQELLDSLFMKRQLLRVGKPGAYQYRYMTWGPGTYEHVGSRFDKWFADWWHRIETAETVAAIYGDKTPISRVVPREPSLPFHMEILPTESISHILTHEVTHIAKTTCVCRTKAKLGGGGCDAPRDGICMWTNEWAIMEAETGEGEMITVDEALKVVERGQKAELVHAVTFCGSTWWICNCCRCCCDLLAPRLAGIYQAAANSNFLPALDLELCNGCKDCISPCPSESISFVVKDKKVAINEETCIGCGLCVVECPQDAMTLKRRPKEQVVVYPVNGDELLRVLAHERGKTFWYK